MPQEKFDKKRLPLRSCYSVLKMKEHERLKLVRKTLNQTQLEFSEALEIKQGSYSDVERGKAGISSALIKHLIRKFNVNPIWLIEGDGNMFIEQHQVNLLSNFSEGVCNEAKTTEPTELDNQLEQAHLQQKALAAIDDIIDFLK